MGKKQTKVETTHYHSFSFIDADTETVESSVGADVHEDFTLITSLATKAECRGQGSARKIMEYALAFIKKLYPDKRIEIDASAEDEEVTLEGLISFYESLGFQNPQPNKQGTVTLVMEPPYEDFLNGLDSQDEA